VVGGRGVGGGGGGGLLLGMLCLVLAMGLGRYRPGGSGARAAGGWRVAGGCGGAESVGE